MTKQIKTGVRADSSTIDISYSSLDDAIKYLQDLKKEHANLKNLWIKSTQRQYDEGYDLVLVHDRLETDRELQERKAREQENASWRKKQYEVLKKEFEK